MAMVFILFFGTTFTIKLFFTDSIGTKELAEIYVPDYKFESGDELVMVYIGSPFCGYCNSPEMPEFIEAAKLKGKSLADSLGMNYVVYGLAISWSAYEGMDHLKKFGLFDEMMLGRSWSNSAAIKYIHTDIPSGRVGAVPQVVYTTREIMYQENDTKDDYLISNEKEYIRLEGYDEIKNFVQINPDL